MKIRTLYLFPLLSVLFLACAAEEDRIDQVERDTTTATESDAALDHYHEGDKVILFLGNSLSAGLGVESEEAFPSLIQDRIDSLKWPFRVVNAGVSGETTAGGVSRIDWLLRQHVDVLVLELGGNDGLRGISTDVTRRNLEEIVERTRETYPEVTIVLAGMQLPPNLGIDYTSRFREIYSELAQEHDIHLIPFLLEGVGGVDSMMQGDGIHPNSAGHRRVAKNVWEVLEPILIEMQQPLA